MGNVLLPIQCTYAPTGSYTANPPSKLEPVRFNVTKAGTTELATAHGVVVTLTIRVKGLSLLRFEDGFPIYDLDFEVTPKFHRLLDDKMREPGVEAN